MMLTTNAWIMVNNSIAIVMPRCLTYFRSYITPTFEVSYRYTAEDRAFLQQTVGTGNTVCYDTPMTMTTWQFMDVK